MPGISKVPNLHNPDIVVRLANSQEELRLANTLVFRNYVQDGFWENDETQLETNKYLHSLNRTVFVVLEKGILIGTMSIIHDSPDGLPSDGTQKTLMQRLRAKDETLAEVSAFAMDRSKSSYRKLILFLMSYVLQYSFYYAGIDRFIASCKPEHANFYESVLCFSKVSDLTYYNYSHACGYLINLDLLEAHWLLSQKYPADPATGQSLYRFLLCDPNPSQDFPQFLALKRPRNMNWVELSMRRTAA